MTKELKEFGVEAYGYDPLLSKEEIEGFGVNALDNLDVKIKMDGVIVAVAHDEFKRFSFSTNLFFQTLGKFNQNASRKKSFNKRTIPFLSTGSFFRKKVY